MAYSAFAVNSKGKVRALAVAMDKRHPQLPDVPTFRELGIDWVDGRTMAHVLADHLPELKSHAALLKNPFHLWNAPANRT